MKKITRPWGYFRTLVHTARMWVKYIHVDKNARTSWQAHALRVEIVLRSPIVITRIGELHTLTKGRHIEIALGSPLESDIMRWQDDYGRSDLDPYQIETRIVARTIYSKQAKTSTPAKWSRKGTCPDCSCSTGCRHKPHCKLVYVRR
jgi:hypothetical protein